MIIENNVCSCSDSKNCAGLISYSEDSRIIYHLYVPDFLEEISNSEHTVAEELTVEEIFETVNRNISPEYFCTVLWNFVKKATSSGGESINIASLELDDNFKTKSNFFILRGVRNLVILDLKDYNYEEYYVSSEILRYKMKQVYPYMDTVDALILKIKTASKPNIMLFFSKDNLWIFEKSFVDKSVTPLTESLRLI
jgi:hypothetical protein